MELSEHDKIVITLLGFEGGLEDCYKIRDWFIERYGLSVQMLRKANGNYLIFVKKDKKNLLVRTYKFYPGTIVQIRMMIRLFKIDKNIHGPNSDYYYLEDDERWQF